MHKELHESPLYQAVVLAYQQPGIGLPKLAKMIAQASKEGRLDEAHVLADSLIGTACRAGRYLGVAERLARKLVREQPDRFHLNHLAKILELRGKKREAASVRRKATRARDQHMTPEIAQAIREAEEGLGRNRSS